jgi:hypothetical protein
MVNEELHLPFKVIGLDGITRIYCSGHDAFNRPEYPCEAVKVIEKDE